MPTQTHMQDATYSPAPGMYANAAEIKWFSVSGASYSKLTKHNSPSILCITYHCDSRTINEVVCIEHKGFPQMQAIEWWKQRTNKTMPHSVDEAIALSSELRVPIAIKACNVNRRYPVIVEYVFQSIN